MKKNNKKKLPRFALGTRHPMYMGYLRNLGIGAANVTTTKGEDLQPEVDAMRANLIPNALNRFLQNAMMPMQMLYGTSKTSGTGAAGVAGTTPQLAGLNGIARPGTALNTIVTNKAAGFPAGINSALNTILGATTNLSWMQGAASNMPSIMNTAAPQTFTASTPLSQSMANTLTSGFLTPGLLFSASLVGNTGDLAANANISANVGQSAGQSAGQTAGKLALSAAGKVAGVLGTAYGGYSVINDVLHAGDIRSVGQMRNTRNVNTVTTGGGNTYTSYGTGNASAEREYERLAAIGKKVGLTTDAIGLGASAGGLIGSAVPGVGTLIGTGVGALAGLVGGGIASLLGFGDNEEEVENNINMLAEETARTNRLNKSIAESLDVKDAFYNRAENGKQPVWTPAGLANRKATALVSNGELIGNFEDGYVSRVPGKKNNKDTVAAALKGSDFVISNKYGLSDYAAATGDYTGALNMLNMLLNHYCKGKMPKYAFGTLGDYALATLPHFGAFMTHLANRRRISEAPVETKDMFVLDSLGADALDLLGSFRFNELPYVRDAQRGLNLANWDVRRNVGLGIGGRAIAANANFRLYLDALQKIHTTANEQNNQLRANYANAKMQYGANELARRMQALQQMHQWRQQANAAKENMMATEGNNMLMSTLDAAKDFLSMKQYKQALGIQNKMLGLYQLLSDLDMAKYLQLLQSMRQPG